MGRFVQENISEYILRGISSYSCFQSDYIYILISKLEKTPAHACLDLYLAEGKSQLIFEIRGIWYFPSWTHRIHLKNLNAQKSKVVGKLNNAVPPTVNKLFKNDW